MKVTLEFTLPDEEIEYKAARQGLVCKETLDGLIIRLCKLRFGREPERPPCPELGPLLGILERQMEELGLNW